MRSQGIKKIINENFLIVQKGFSLTDRLRHAFTQAIQSSRCRLKLNLKPDLIQYKFQIYNFSGGCRKKCKRRTLETQVKTGKRGQFSTSGNGISFVDELKFSFCDVIQRNSYKKIYFSFGGKSWGAGVRKSWETPIKALELGVFLRQRPRGPRKRTLFHICQVRNRFFKGAIL